MIQFWRGADRPSGRLKSGC